MTLKPTMLAGKSCTDLKLINDKKSCAIFNRLYFSFRKTKFEDANFNGYFITSVPIQYVCEFVLYCSNGNRLEINP